MPHGTPDWGQIPDVAGYTLTEDLAELAARLGSICTFDRRGSILFMDSFKDGVNKWEVTGSDNGESFEPYATRTQLGPYCGRIITGDVSGNYIRLIRYLYYTQAIKLGFELSFTLDNKASQVTWGWTGRSGAKTLSAAITYNTGDNKLYYSNEDGDDIEFANDLPLSDILFRFHTAKSVIDLKTGKYVRFILNDTEYDLSSYSYRVQDSDVVPYLYVYYDVRVAANAASTTYIDNIVITRNES